MKRHLRPLLLSLIGILAATFLSALINIWTATIPQDHPLIVYVPHTIAVLLCAAVGIGAWQYVAERKAEADGVPPPETPRGLMIAKVRAMWIAGVLERSLYRAVQLAPGLRSDPGRVDLPLRAQVQEAGGQAEDLAEGTRIVNVYDRFGGALLILGAPGAGKTTLLLKLARELLGRAEADPTLPIPVVFPLSTWAAERKPFDQWLIDQLRVLYQVSKKQAMVWVEQHQILPLLDGLDEVAEAHRSACVRAINAFREERGTLPLVVCSRLREYETVAQEAAQLWLHGAVIVQTLRQAAVLEALAELGPEVVALRDTLAGDQRDWLWKVATSPLGLSVLIPAVQHSPGLLQAGGSDNARRDRIFGAYVDAMFARRAVSGQWSREKTIHHLSWLAAQMQARGQTLFLLEGLQPDWLSRPWQHKLVRWSVLLFGAPIFAFTGLFYGAIFGDLFKWSLIGLLIGSLNGLLSVLVKLGNNRIITPVNRLIWSWPDFSGKLWVLVLIVLIETLIFIILGEIVNKLNIIPYLNSNFAANKFIWVFTGASVSILFALLLIGLNLRSLEINYRPNQGIINSIRYALVIGPFFGFAIGLVFGLSFGLITVQENTVIIGLSAGLGSAIGGGLIMGLRYGGVAVIQHYTLRLLLAHADLAPLRYAAFLDHAAERVLLRRVGGGWVFVHRLLLDYFAGLASGLGVPLPAPKEEAQAEGEAAS